MHGILLVYSLTKFHCIHRVLRLHDQLNKMEDTIIDKQFAYDLFASLSLDKYEAWITSFGV